MVKENGLIEKLKSRGIRITKIRENLIMIFSSLSQPLTIPEINLEIKQNGLSANKSTLYREIDFLKSQKIIKELDFGENKKRYELISTSPKNHLVCLKCKKIFDFQANFDLGKEDKRVYRQTGFKIIRYSLELFGLCIKCQDFSS